MSFSVKKRQSKSIKTNFSNGTDYAVLSNEELDLLANGLANGDLTAIKPIIFSHIRLAIKIAGQYCFRPSQDQDLVSIAFLALLDGCLDIAASGSITNITGYLVSRVHSRCSRYACEDRVVRVPRSSLIHAAKNGKRITVPTFKSSVALVKVKNTNSKASDLLEFINSCCLDDRELAIVKLRIDNYTNAEIGELLKISQVRVGQIIHEIEDRYERKIRLLD
jgi:RNA polymerase sigma factor (sigma-70 family)